MMLVDDLRSIIPMIQEYGHLWFDDADIEHAVTARLDAIVAAYDALAPDWDDAPDWAKWYAIDSGGDGYWCIDEPTLEGWEWVTPEYAFFAENDIPAGIDFRLCCWKRPEQEANDYAEGGGHEEVKRE